MKASLEKRREVLPVWQWRLAIGVVASVLAVAFLPGAGSGRPAAEIAGKHLAAPAALLRDLAALDVKLTALVRREAGGERLGYAELQRELEAAHKATIELTNHFGSNEVGKLSGQDPGRVMRLLECVDSGISFAYGQSTDESQHQLKSTTVLFLALGKIGSAWDCADTLAKELAGAQQPSGLTEAATKVGLAPAHVIEHWLKAIIPSIGGHKSGDLTEGTLLANNEKYLEKKLLGDVKAAVAEAGHAKETMARTYFTGNLYGVPAADVILGIDCVGENLAFAEGVNTQASQHAFSSDVRDELYKVLERARKCKQKLEAALRNAKQEAKAGTTITTKVGPPVISGGG